MYTNLTPFRFTAGQIDAQAVDLGHFVFVDKEFDQDKEGFHDWLFEQTKDHPDKERIVLFPFKHVKRFTVDANERGYRIRYKLPDGKRVTSDAVYTAEQINQIFFIAVRKEHYDGIVELNTALRKIAPEDFFFAFVQEEIEIFLVDASIPATTEQDIRKMIEEANNATCETTAGGGSSCGCGGNGDGSCGCGGAGANGGGGCGCH